MRQAGVMLAVAVLGGCGGTATKVLPKPAEAARLPARTESPGENRRKVSVETDTYSLSYSYPARADAFPELARLLDTRREQTRTDLSVQSDRERTEQQANGFPFHKHSNDTRWMVVADVPNWLSLSARTYFYSGGAHGMTTFDALVWDKQAGRALKPGDFFDSPQGLSDTVRNAFCAELDRQRAKKRGEPVDRSDQDFGACIDPVENSTVTLASTNGRTFDRVGFLVPPANAGPYVEGTYEVTLPVTPAILSRVRPMYRASFSLLR